MNINNLKRKIIWIILVIGALLILIFQRGLYSRSDLTNNTAPDAKSSVPAQSSNQEIKIISTNPDPLEEAVILPTQTIEITFNIPLENKGEFKNKIEPLLNPLSDYEIKLSDDRKTAKIIPTIPFKLGTTFTLFILPASKFDGKRQLGKEIIYHFKTIEYRGI